MLIFKESGNVRWSREEHLLTSSILIDTVLRLKGLERDVIIFWVNQHTVTNGAEMYVGSSSAKSVLYIVSKG